MVIINAALVIMSETRETRKRKTFSSCLDGSCTAAEPIAKRTRSACQKIPEITNVENDRTSHEPTILDVLNDDCWKVILDYMSLLDLIRTETVSKHWYSVVQRYLRGVRVNLRHSDYVNYEIPIRKRLLYIPPYNLREAVEKFGRTVVAAYCEDAEDLKLLKKHCPDLEDLKVIDPHDYLKNRVVNFKKLKAVSFMNVYRFNDRHVTRYLSSTVLDDLWVHDNIKMTGSCLTNLQSNLKAIQLESCRILDINYLLAASDRLTELTKLALSCNPISILKNAYKLIEKTPKLEILALEWYRLPTDVGGLVDAISRLSRLRHLSFCNNTNVRDNWLETVGRSCKELRIAALAHCENVTAAGVAALCRGVGSTLERLDVSFNDNITDEAAVCFISSCPKLEMLNVQYNLSVTKSLPATTAAVLTAEAAAGTTRPRPMSLRISRHLFPASPPKDTYLPDLTLDFSKNELTPWEFYY